MSREEPICIGYRIPRPRTGNSPLWTYILAEAMHTEAVRIPMEEGVTLTTPQLARVGARIVAEVFLVAMFADKHWLLNLEPNLHPVSNSENALKDFVEYAFGK
jgi:hypothetical protein